MSVVSFYYNIILFHPILHFKKVKYFNIKDQIFYTFHT
ncbi:hypothetical protein G436_1227 [Leptospira interrogans serovar Hardjo str. Norma]|uniref:Uncharacterized protein n=2 Tax=Leptospira interrogans TaxID=173 RepID=A0A0E2CYK2_LEPIR|nr:hypothetical protein G436_1227 [Leptospira interrogans serovar Hardjo str. Norma]EKR18889.1 hypothetical protein LEP1GSC019_0810 [Leptospira interrogans serovar Pyrogenes str. 2006006960]EKR52861.1 hypothetical protein LEP1GSC105_0757 [Leptospira interrogans str. UI 12758]EMN08502.1 hypothetical protein LEP1GSC053_2400 [Leptospira interrogans serovar Muenchen str. Brem 129]